jgi:hypothetical protein
MLITTAESSQVSTKSNFKGPFSDNYVIEDDVAFTSTVGSPCGANLPLNIKSRISRASSDPKAKGLITDDSVNGNIKFITGMQWRRCYGSTFETSVHLWAETGRR